MHHQHRLPGVILIAAALALDSCSWLQEASTTYPYLGQPKRVSLVEAVRSADPARFAIGIRLHGKPDSRRDPTYQLTIGPDQLPIPTDRTGTLNRIGRLKASEEGVPDGQAPSDPTWPSHLNRQIYLTDREVRTLFKEEIGDNEVRSGLLQITAGKVVGASFTPEPKDSDFDDHGWLGMGVGVGQIFNAHHGKNNDHQNDDILSTWVNFRAYPFGKWFTNGYDRVGSTRTRDLTIAASRESQLIQRLSLVWGISIAELGSDHAIDEVAHVLGIGFDIAPEFTMIAGVSFFQLNAGYESGRHAEALFFGMSMNFDAYSQFLGKQAMVFDR